MIPPALRGQIVEVDYVDTRDGLGWRVTTDRSDGSVSVEVTDMASCGHVVRRCTCWDPANTEPLGFDWEPSTMRIMSRVLRVLQSKDLRAIARLAQSHARTMGCSPVGASYARIAYEAVCLAQEREREWDPANAEPRGFDWEPSTV